MERITVVGSLNIDLVVRAPRMPLPGESVIGSDFRTIPGGKGANQALAAARLGAQVSMIGKVGGDGFGRTQIQTLAAVGVDTRGILVDPDAATGIALITLDASGQNAIVLDPGANMRLSIDDVDRARLAVAKCSVLCLQLEIPLEVVSYAISVAHEHDVPVVLNPAPAPTTPLDPQLLTQVDYLIPNEVETLRLTGIEALDQSSAKRAAKALLDLGVGTVILTLGSQGALLATPECTLMIPAHAVNVVDTTAAGDAFVAGFSVAMAEGKEAVDAVRWANACGALAVTVLGAQPSLPTRAEVEAFRATQTVP